MIGTGRPLRFLALVIGGWIGARAALLWPAQIVPALAHAVAPPAVAAEAPPAAAVATPARAIPAVELPRRAALPSLSKTAASSSDPVAAARADPPAFALASGGAPPSVATIPASVFVPGVDPPPTFTVSRWSGSVWAILRPNGRATPFASQLGGSQAGARIAYALDGARRLAVYGRVSSAIDAAEREAAVGVDWRPTRLPVHLIAERRIGIEGVRGGTAVGAVGGIGPTPIAGPVRVEGYAQGGVILRQGAEGFADGSVRVTLPIAARVDLGLGGWGGAQRGAARLDVGPTVGLAIPVARHSLRLSADWRRRLAGRARPGTGFAVSLGADF